MSEIDIIFWDESFSETKIIKTLYSVYSQSFSKWRCLVVNYSFSKAQKLKEANKFLLDERFIYIQEETREQVNTIGLFLYKFLKSQYVAFIRCPDLWLTNKLAVNIDIIESRHDVAVASNSIVCENGYEWKSDMVRAFPQYRLGKSFVKDLIWLKFDVISSLMLRKDKFKKFLDDNFEYCHLSDPILLRASLGGLFIYRKPLVIQYIDRDYLSERNELFLNELSNYSRNCLSESECKHVNILSNILELEILLIKGNISFLKMIKYVLRTKEYKHYAVEFLRKIKNKFNYFRKRFFLDKTTGDSNCFLNNSEYRAFIDYKQNCFLASEIDMRKCMKADSKPEYACVVFSKDRPLQLHGLLKSMAMNFVQLPEKIYILYSSSDTRYFTAYNEIIKEFSCFAHFRFIHETEAGFKNNLLDILYQIDQKRIFYLVDDIVVVEKIDLSIFDEIDLEKTVPSLRLGKNISYYYIKSENLALPLFENDSSPLNTWNWSQGFGYWNYPLSVDGNIFITKDIIIMTENIDFNGPNSYEWKLQIYNKYFLEKKGICSSKSSIFNIPCNRVQEEVANKAGNLSHEKLLEFWESGKRLDCEQLKGYINISPHEEISLPLYKL